MKKAFTLLFTLCTIAFAGIAKAQSVYVSYQPTVKPLYISGKFYRYNNAYSFTKQERDYELAKINNQYSASVKSVLNMRFISAAEKVHLIRNMEAKKDSRINAVCMRFNDYRNKFNNDYYNGDYGRRGR